MNFDSTIGLEIAVLLAALLGAAAILYRRRQSRRALERRVADLSALADVGRAITDAPLDLGRLAEVVYRQAGQIVDTSIFQLGLFRGDRYRLLIWIVDGQPQPTAEFRLTPTSLGIVGWMRKSRRSLLVRDFESERDTLPAQPRYISPNPPRSAVFVPLIAADSVLGAIAIQNRRPSAFSEEDLRLLTIVANHAAAALEKARVYEQAQRRAAHLALLSEVSEQINVLQPLPSLYRQIVDRAAEKLGDYEVSFFEYSDGLLTLRASTIPGWQEQAAGVRAGGAAAEAASTGRLVVREELPELGRQDPGGARIESPAELAAPVEINARVLGVLNVKSRTASAFDENTVALFDSLARQMAFAILEGELFAAEQRRAEQLAAIAQVSRTIVSNLDLEDLFDEVLDRVEESFGYKRAHIFLLQEDRLVFRAGIGRGAARWSVEGLAHDLDGPGLIAQAGRARRAMLAEDAPAESNSEALARLDDTRSEMAAPMIMGAALLGVFDVQSEKRGEFAGENLQTLQTLADTLAVAVRNARLFDIERRRRRLAETLREVSTALTSTLNLDDVLDLILDGLARVVSYDAASILLVNDSGDVVLRASRGLPELQDAVGETLDIRLLPKGEPFPATVNFGEVDAAGEYHDLLSLPDPHACLGAVLALRGEHIGYLVVDRAGLSHFPRGEVELIGAFASQAAVAIENARLYNAQMEQAWVSTALLQVAEATTRATEVSEVIQTAARLTPMLVGVDRCAVLLREEDEFTVRAFYGDKIALPSTETLPGFAPSEWPRLREIIDTQEAAVLSDVDLDDSMPADLRRLFADVVILLPLLAKGQVQGLLAVGQQMGESPFDAHRVQLLSGIANQTALAIESLTLYESQQEEAWVSAALLQVAEAVARQTTLDEGLEAVARLAPMLVGIDCVAIYGWDEAAKVFHISQVAGSSKAKLAALARLPLAAGDLGIDPQADAHSIPRLRLPEALAATFGCSEAMIWTLHARGDLLGALMVEYAPPAALGRRLSILDGIAHQLAIAMENARLSREVLLQQRLERDVELAHDIQASFLPEACPVVGGWEVCSYWQAARQVGGDFYDFIPLKPREDGGERWGIVIADVADKGVAAALYMALSRTLMRTVAISRVAPSSSLSRVNELIFADAKTDLFVTVFYAVWEPATGRLQYVNAGHNPPVWVGPERTPITLSGRGVPIGVFDEAVYQEHEVHVKPGEALLLYTDGVPDAVNVEREEFGIARVKDVMAAHYTGTATQILNAVSAAVAAHVGEAEAFDDMAMVVLKRKNRV